MKWAGPMLILLILPLGLMWKVWGEGKAAFPGDLLVGAYYPWMERIPVKNPLLSDSFSQNFPWKMMVAENLRVGKLALWNPFTLSGTPLLANFHSGVLYPLNIFLLIPDFLSGWHLLLYAQLAGCGVAMYWYLRKLRYPPAASLLGAITYAYSGFLLVSWELTHAGQAMIWLPLILLAVELKRLWMVPVLYFSLITAGHFQTAVYSLALGAGYFWYRGGEKRTVRMVFYWGLALGVAAIQLIPTIELSRLSIRFSENYISQLNFGLLPVGHLAKLVAPDFFGHPSTRNYWGFFNYQESTMYVGVIGAMAMLWALYHFTRLNRVEKFFLFTGIIALILAFDTPLGRMVYKLELPGLSTSAASRMLVILGPVSGVLTAGFVTNFPKLKIKEILVLTVGMTIINGLGLTDPEWSKNSVVIIRNLVMPGLLIFGIGLAGLGRKWPKFALGLLGILMVADVFRFGWKYNPFTDKKWVFPFAPEIQFLKSQPGIFRIDRENTALFPPNIWEAYGLMSPSGYEPMAIRAYATAYQEFINGVPESTPSRYTTLSSYDPEILGKYGVKYLLAVKENTKVDLRKWNKVFEGRSVWVLENPRFVPLAGEDSVIEDWRAGYVKVETQREIAGKLTISQSFFPGWKAKVNDKPVRVEKTAENFQTLAVGAGKSEVVLSFLPDSLGWGALLSLVSLWAVVFLRRLERVAEEGWGGIGERNDLGSARELA